MIKTLSIFLLATVTIAPVRSMAQVTNVPPESAVAALSAEKGAFSALGGAAERSESATPKNEKERVPFSELPLSEQIKQIAAFSCFCFVLALYLFRNKIGAWVEGKPVWIQAIWRTLCMVGRYVLRPVLVMMKWMILLPLLLMCKMFKLGSKAAWISAKLTGKAALTVAKEVQITGGVFGQPGEGGGSSSRSYEQEARREAERQRKEEAKRQEKADRTPMSATVNNNGQVIAKNRFGKVLFGVSPNGKNPSAYVSDGCLVVNSTASNGTKYLQIWGMDGKMIRTEAQPK